MQACIKITSIKISGSESQKKYIQGLREADYLYRGMLVRRALSEQWEAKFLSLYLLSGVAGERKKRQTKYITPKQIVHTIVHHRTLVHRKTEKNLAYLNLLSKILLSDKIKRYISENSFVKASLSKNSETVSSFTSAIGFITDGLPRLSSLLSFSIKHNGTFPTNTFRSAAREKWTSRPKLLRCGWQDL